MFLPLSFWDDVAKWTEQKFSLEGNRYKVDRADVLGVLVIWFLSGIVTLPSVDIMFKLGMGQMFKLIQMSSRDSNCLPKEFWYNQLMSKLQFNKPCLLAERLNVNGRINSLYLIRLLLELMEDRFRLGWIPSKDLTCDESLWDFKDRMFLKCFMKDKPKKYSFLEYALCTLNGYFLHVLVNHVPSKAKRIARKLNKTNLDHDSLLQLKLQTQYGEQGAILLRLASQLSYSSHHIIADNAFSSCQLATDLHWGKVQGIKVKKAIYTGTQVMQKSITKRPMAFVEYRNLLSSGWGRIPKYGHEWYSDNDQGISIIRFHGKKQITLLSTEYHGCEVDEVSCTRNRKRSVVTIPKMVKFYSKKGRS